MHIFGIKNRSVVKLKILFAKQATRASSSSSSCVQMSQKLNKFHFLPFFFTSILICAQWKELKFPSLKAAIAVESS